MTTPTPSSSWISSIVYRNPGGFLAVFPVQDGNDTPVVLLYGGVPSWVPGLLCAGTGRRSIGRAYNTLIKGRYQYQRVEGWAQVNQLKSLMEGVAP